LAGAPLFRNRISVLGIAGQRLRDANAVATKSPIATREQDSIKRAESLIQQHGARAAGSWHDDD
jgi:hypothetical protein